MLNDRIIRRNRDRLHRLRMANDEIDRIAFLIEYRIAAGCITGTITHFVDSRLGKLALSTLEQVGLSRRYTVIRNLIGDGLIIDSGKHTRILAFAEIDRLIESIVQTVRKCNTRQYERQPK